MRTRTVALIGLYPTTWAASVGAVWLCSRPSVAGFLGIGLSAVVGVLLIVGCVRVAVLVLRRLEK